MGTKDSYAEVAPTRDEVDATPGPFVVEFGNDWCGHCRRAQPLIEGAFAAHPRVRRLKIADGPGRRLGRSFRVKLWPTLVFLADGKEVAQVVRPTDENQIREALSLIDK
jgi:thioredoxin 1